MWKLPQPLAFDGRLRKLAIAVVVVIVIAVGASLYSQRLVPRILAQVESQIESISEALDRRSPGERLVGELSKGEKGSKSNIADLPLQQRALGKVFPPPVESLTQPLIAGPELANPGSLLTSPLALVSLPPGLQVIGGPGSGGFGPPGGGFSPPGGGGLILPPPGGVGTIPPPPGTTVPPPPEVPAVPEPSTWAMLIMGFAFCAAVMRKRLSPTSTSKLLPCTQL